MNDTALELVVYRFNDYQLNVATCELWQYNRTIEFSSHCALVLSYLIQNRARIVARDELFRVLWGDINVSDHCLTQAIFKIRRTLANTEGESTFIKTIRGRGYRFVAPVTVHQLQIEQHASSMVAKNGTVSQYGMRQG